MPYKYNPHRQVKIWSSLDPEFFLSPLNQLRLILAQYKNPKSTFALVDESLRQNITKLVQTTYKKLQSNNEHYSGFMRQTLASDQLPFESF